jgi:hypothetical protein
VSGGRLPRPAFRRLGRCSRRGSVPRPRCVYRRVGAAAAKAAQLIGAAPLHDRQTTTWLALLHLLYTSPPAGSPSKNLSMLYPRLLPSLLDFPIGHGARPLLSQLILHLDHLSSWAWDNPAAELGQARELIYDLSTYADPPDFGPYFVGFGFSSDPDDDGGVKVRGVDWEKVRCLSSTRLSSQGARH